MIAPGLKLSMAAVVLWSSNAVVVKIVLTEATVTQVLALQFTSASVMLVIMHLVSGSRVSKTGRQIHDPFDIKAMALGIVGIVGTISFQVLAFGQAPIMQANIIAYSWPLFAAIWWAVFRWSRDGLWYVGMGLAGFAGVALVMAKGPSFAFSGDFLGGYAFALASAFCMAFYTLAAGTTRNPGPLTLLPATVAGAAVTLFLALDPSLPSSVPWPSAGSLLLGVYLGMGPMALGYFLWMRAMSKGNAAGLAQTGFLTPLLSTFWLFIAGEALSRLNMLGAVFIIGASIAAVLHAGTDGGLRALFMGAARRKPNRNDPPANRRPQQINPSR